MVYRMFVDFSAFVSFIVGWQGPGGSLLAHGRVTGGEIWVVMLWSDHIHVDWRNGRSGGGPQGSERAKGRVLGVILIEPCGCVRPKRTLRQDV